MLERAIVKPVWKKSGTIGGARLPNDLEATNSAYDVCEDRMLQDRLICRAAGTSVVQLGLNVSPRQETRARRRGARSATARHVYRLRLYTTAGCATDF